MNSPLTQGYGAWGRLLYQGYGGPQPADRSIVVRWYPTLRRPRRRVRRAQRPN
jgi:hypothetical protein